MMRRKLIKQGGTGLTVYLPKKWVDSAGLKQGDEIDIVEEDEKLVIVSAGFERPLKSASITVGAENYNIYRSLIGGLYRGGFDEIKIKFSDPKILPTLQKTIDSLYGFEIFDVSEASCVVKSVYQEDAGDVQSHAMKAIHIIKTMQSILMEDIAKKRFTSKEEMFHFRNSVLKHRDVVARTVIHQKLLENSHFPYYQLMFNLWAIARNYYNMYDHLCESKKISKNDTDLLNNTNKFFADYFTGLEKHKLQDKHKEYNKAKAEALTSFSDPKGASLVASYCLNILMMIQSCNSHVLMLNFSGVPDY